MKSSKLFSKIVVLDFSFSLEILVQWPMAQLYRMQIILSSVNYCIKPSLDSVELWVDEEILA